MKLLLANIGLVLISAQWNMGIAQPAAQTAPSAAVEGLRYEHRLERSRFDVGGDVRREVEGPYERIVGDRGVFMIDRVTGATLAVPNTPYDVAKGGPLGDFYPKPLTNSPDEHNAVVRSYLVAAGVPEAEVSGAHVTTTMAGDGPTTLGVEPLRSRLLWYTTHLERSLGGIPVLGSFAFAALDSGGKVITEGSYWPAIPERVVRSAQALREKLRSDRDAFLATVRASRPDVGNATGTVGIVHTSAGHHGEFQAFALYTVVIRNPNGGKARIARFDETGTVVRLADELPSGTDSPKER